MEETLQEGGGAMAPPNPVEAVVEVELPIPAPEPDPEPLPELPTVRVKIADQQAQCWVDGRPVPLPNKLSVIKKLPSPHNKMRVRSYEDLNDKIRQNWGLIPSTAWANAIGQTLIEELASGREAQFESNSIQGANSFLAIGHQLFKLIPTAVTRTNGALAAVRKRTTEVAKAEADRIITEANANASSLTTQAARALREAQEVRARANMELPPPAWAVRAGYPIRFTQNIDNGGIHLWKIGVNLKIRLRSYDYNYTTVQGVVKKRTWYPARETEPVYLLLWVPIIGEQFNVTGIHVDPALGYCHPHVTGNQACMELGIVPYLRDTGEYRNLEYLLNRALSAVQLDSLLCRLERWMPLAAGMPAPLLDAIQTGGQEGLLRYARQLDQQEGGTTEPVPSAATDSEVFEL